MLEQRDVRVSLHQTQLVKYSLVGCFGVSEHQGNYVLSQVEVMMTVLFVCLGKATMKTTEITTCVNKHKRLKLHFYIF